MDEPTAQTLIELNHQFYQKFVDEFSETRRRLQPGVVRILDQLEPNIRILDIGCGNGELARELAQRGLNCFYQGTDFSTKLLAYAREYTPKDFPASFVELDLTQDNWKEKLLPQPFDTIFAFAALHHIPSHPLRVKILKKIRQRIKPQGTFYLSNWQFLNSPKLKKRIQPWEKVGLSKKDIDPADYLMDWRRGGYGLRYVHHFSPQELEDLAQETGFQVKDDFHSDGKSGNLGYYQIWRPV
jgi:2-polyprenyl-3-methyl-5-hydroxy-6-metoxy-1,4-benzoquinol methylase